MSAVPAPAPGPASGGWTCPTCGGAVAPKNPWRPFCGERCKRVDLGAWLLGHYRIPSVADPDLDPDGSAAAGEGLEDPLRSGPADDDDSAS